MHIWQSGRLVTLAERLLTPAVIERHGLVVTGQGTSYAGKPRYDLDSRLIFPVHDPDGELLTWQARDLTGRSAKKYIFPSGVSATDTFYGWRRGITGADGFVLIVEGVFQKLAWDRLGERMERNTVASFGKKLTEAQIRLLIESQAKTILLGWDLDAIPQMCQIALRLNGRRKVFFLPPLKPDPASRDHDEVPAELLLDLLREKVEATPGKIAELMALASLGYFKPGKA